MHYKREYGEIDPDEGGCLGQLCYNSISYAIVIFYS